MRAWSRMIAVSPFLRFVVSVILLFTAGCNARLIKKSDKPAVTRTKIDPIKNMRPAAEHIEKFFDAYGRKEWKTMDNMLSGYSAVRHLRANMEADFKAFVKIEPLVNLSEPELNKALDRAKVHVMFVVEKIDLASGSLLQVRGEGDFVLANRHGWEILGYIGEPFWGGGK